ncbi:MAG: GNAT family N-acetyltransferase [Halobacteriales archaeon]|nr:GNAT family N-acetyltransferase [Halobacteriales archaeon]
MAVTPVEAAADREALRALLREFHAWMAENAAEHAGVAYDVEAELAEDLGSIEDPANTAWLARANGEPAGCVLLLGSPGPLAEFVRLWVTPAARGSKLGRVLVETVIEAARTRGYETLGLTTPPWAGTSHGLYESLGFERTGPYPETRLDEAHHDDAIFMRLDL